MKKILHENYLVAPSMLNLCLRVLLAENGSLSLRLQWRVVLLPRSGVLLLSESNTILINELLVRAAAAPSERNSEKSVKMKLDVRQ